MKFSENWLREWVNPAIDTGELVAQLTMAGLEVDAVEPVAADFSGVVVGHVVSLVQHPDADRLRVCRVDVGQDEPLQIVCGAANVYQGAKVPAALIGAVLPGDFTIKRSKLRGVESFGMLCSAKELGMAENSEGLLLFPVDAPVGADVRDYLKLNDVALDVDLTPNRSDCLSIQGIAREVGVLNQCAVKAPALDAVTASIEASWPVSVSAQAECPRYTGRVIQGIDPTASTPLWLQEVLRRSGIRCIHPVVDVTNYVMLELGQPMHGFDLDKLDGEIEVRLARPGESLTLLDGKTITLDNDVLVIADSSRALAMAGVMGGAQSGVGDTTVNVFLESAFFSPQRLAGKARRYGLHTDSSHRFERGVNYELAGVALERATALILSICGGAAGPAREVSSASHLPQPAVIELRRDRVRRVLGLQLDDAQVSDILTRLGMTLATTEAGWRVTAPAFRFDIALEVDLIEEIGRVYGYSNLPVSRPHAALTIAPRAEADVALDRLRSVLVDRGYQEAITYSFVDAETQAMLDPANTAIPLANPISSDMAVMRTTLWAGLLQAQVYNLNRQQTRVRLFESGLRFINTGSAIEQTPRLAGLVCGGLAAEQWAESLRQVDFFDVKADVEALLGCSGLDMRFVAAEHAALHPGQSAQVWLAGQAVGWLGAVHPQLAAKLDVPARTYLFELDLAAISQGCLPRFAEVSKFPAIRRDMAFVVEDSVTAQAILDCVKENASSLLRDLQLFDMYKGKGIDSGHKSLALAVVLQDHSRTLTDEDVDAAVTAIVTAVKTKFNARLRD